MYKKVNISENHLRALMLFSGDSNEEYYIRQTGKLLGISSRTAQLLLNELEEKGVLASKTKGKIKLYSLHKANPISQQYLIIAENYKTLLWFTHHYRFKQLFLELGKLNPLAIVTLFGSYAKGTMESDSDLDVFAVTDRRFDEASLQTLFARSSVKINIKYSTLEGFKKEDFLIKEIIKSHVCIQNTDAFVKLIW